MIRYRRSLFYKLYKLELVRTLVIRFVHDRREIINLCVPGEVYSQE